MTEPDTTPEVAPVTPPPAAPSAKGGVTKADASNVEPSDHAHEVAKASRDEAVEAMAKGYEAQGDTESAAAVRNRFAG